MGELHLEYRSQTTAINHRAISRAVIRSESVKNSRITAVSSFSIPVTNKTTVVVR